MLREESKIKALCWLILFMSKKMKKHKKIVRNKRKLQSSPEIYKNKIRKTARKQI
jgi:hypothetical protein